MSIQIDQSIFLPKIKEYSTSSRRNSKFQDNIVDIAREALDIAQGWFDDEPWRSNPVEHYDTQRECRVELKRYISKHDLVGNPNKSYFLPHIVWSFIAQQVISWIVKLIIEHYWPDLINEMGLEF
jgi:hypothetical protein